jgi:hypothetical protein
MNADGTGEDMTPELDEPESIVSDADSSTADSESN